MVLLIELVAGVYIGGALWTLIYGWNAVRAARGFVCRHDWPRLLWAAAVWPVVWVRVLLEREPT